MHNLYRELTVDCTNPIMKTTFAIQYEMSGLKGITSLQGRIKDYLLCFFLLSFCAE